MLRKTSWPEKSSIPADILIQQFKNNEVDVNDIYLMMFDDRICRNDWERIMYEAIVPDTETHGIWRLVDHEDYKYHLSNEDENATQN